MFINEQMVLQVDIHAISEHCLDTTQLTITSNARQILRQQYHGRALLQLDSSSEPAMNRYKPGGTGLMVLGPITSRLEPKGRGGDPMGRWSYVHIRRKHLPPLTVISAYQVCPRPTNQIGNTAYHQQQRALNAAGRHNLHPRNAFMNDLSDFIASLRGQHHDILLGGDFNEALTDKNSGIHKLATTHNLIDPFLSRFPQHEPFGTHSSGQRRIDITLMSPRLLGSLKRVGYGPFNFTIMSDHRPVLLDFDTKHLFGESSDLIQPLHNRVFHSKDRKAVQQFIETMYDEIHRRQGFRYQNDIDADKVAPEVIEQVDAIIGQSGVLAERKCRKRRPEFYSQPLVQQRLRVSILRAHLNAMKQSRDRSPQLHARSKRLGIHVELPCTRQLTQLALQEARNKLREISQEHTSLRQKELDDKIAIAAAQGNRQHSKIIRAIKTVETGKQTYRILRLMRRPEGTSQSIDRIEIPASWPPPSSTVPTIYQLEDPKTCTEWRLITDPAEIEYYLMTRNRMHFGQAEGTPFTCPPLRTDIDWATTTSASDEVLQGTYEFTSSIPECRNLVEACKAVTELDGLPAEVTMAEFRGKIKTWREATTTSPSGRHLGHYKALFARGTNDEDQNDPFTTKQIEIAQLLLSVMNYCIRHNYVLQRWKKIVNVMIFKEPMNFQIHRLRVIHIYEADFNLLLAVKWRQLLRSADDNNLINEGQYGGRPGCEAQSLTLLEELKYDLSYLTRRSLVNFDNDATSCYDRILVPVASLVNRKYGLHRQVVAVHASTLQQAQFCLKTATGVSELQYSHCDQYPIHGTGQGSGNSPCIWLFISSTLFDIHAQLSHGVTFVSPDGKNKVHMSMVGFVDDSTGSCNDFQPSYQAPLQELFQRMQYDAQLWNNLLYCSGGKLELPKCSFHVLHFDFQPDGKPIPTIERFDNRIHITDADTQATISIPARRAFETHKTLGHHKSPHSAIQAILTDLRVKMDHLALLLSISPITRSGAYLAYYTVYLPTIRYTLPQSFYPRKLLDKCQAHSMGRVIAKCGYNRHIARALMFAPTFSGGGGFVPWYVLQGEGQIQHVLKHWRTNTIVSNTLKIAIQWAQWQSGHERPILEDTATPIPYLDCRWIASTRTFLSTIKASLILDQPLVPRTERTHDFYIMQYARDCGLFQSKDLAIINYCRLYLHVTTVSELFDAGGTHILPHAISCQREPWFDSKTYITLQRRPSEYQIRTKWKRLCRQWTTSDGRLAESLTLGKWTTTGQRLRRRRQTYQTNPRPHRVYHWHEGSYWEYVPTADPHVYQPLSPTTWEPTENCTPITSHETHARNLYLRLSQAHPLLRVRLRPPTSFHQYVTTLQDWERDLLTGITFELQPYEIHHNIQALPIAASLYLVSDGSQKRHQLSYGWVYGTSNGVVYAEQSGRGYGTPTSHRAEGWGMLSGALFLAHLHQYINMSQPPPLLSTPLQFYSDNNGLVQRINKRRQYKSSYPNSTLEPDWDIIEQIYSTSQLIPHYDITYTWVQGHQDATTTNLPVEAMYNVRADKLAGKVRHPHENRIQNPSWLLPVEKCRLIISGAPVHSNYIHEIRKAATLPPYLKYMRGRHGWTSHTAELVDWPVLESAARSTVIPRTQLVKLIHSKLPTRYELSKSNVFQDPTCPHCRLPETFTHLLRCTSREAQQYRDALLETIEEYFTRHEASPEFRQTFFSSTQYWLDPPTPEDQTDPGSSYPPEFEEQNKIGWSLLPRGFLSSSWRHLYEASSTKALTFASRPIPFLAGLLKLVWDSQLKYWQEYNDKKKDTENPEGWAVSEKRREYQARIRLLHQKRPECLHAHQSQYFYDDVDTFLNQATPTQMRQYLHHYTSAISQSIVAAKKSQSRTIFQFPGFRHYPKRRPIPESINPPRHPTQTDTNTIPGQRGVQIIRKHTRWRSLLPTTKSIRDFFSSSK